MAWTVQIIKAKQDGVHSIIEVVGHVDPYQESIWKESLLQYLIVFNSLQAFLCGRRFHQGGWVIKALLGTSKALAQAVFGVNEPLWKA